MERSEKSNETCRLCDETADIRHSIFEKSNTGQQIIQLIKECLPIIVYRNDPLSKHVCDSCLNKLITLNNFKKISLETAEKHKQHLKNDNNLANKNKNVQLYLSCEENKFESDQVVTLLKKVNIATSTDDISLLCKNCKSALSNPNLVNNEIELCAELHKAIADSLGGTKLITHTETDKVLRNTRRRRSQAFYHELDDSLCSSLTEFTNTESSQCFEEYRSDMESYDSENDVEHRIKRRRIELNPKNDENYDEVEFRYYPLSLMQLTLNVINKLNIPDYEPDDFYVKLNQPRCGYCNLEFKNSRSLALHEGRHISIELGEKVDYPVAWHESRDDADVRNKWLSGGNGDADENEETPGAEYMEVVSENGTMLLPVQIDDQENEGAPCEIVLDYDKPVVNGIALADYSKNERKSFYKSMRIGNLNRKFCTVCRYSFKDNWAIESHYFSLACFYTCRHCGMRFNKQRHQFEDHVREHKIRNDPLSKQVYSATKLNNVVPKMYQPEKVKKPPIEPEPDPKVPPMKVKNLPPRRSVASHQPIKEEVSEDTPTKSVSANSTPKSANQAYFCRKCYKVFFKLDEFNVHSKNCDNSNQFPPLRRYTKRGSGGKTNGELLSPTGRPLRNCVKETGAYKDDVESSTTPEPPSATSQQSFICFICNTPFPNIYSRNSHMRIHKSAITNNTPSTSSYRLRQSSNSIPSFSNYVNSNSEPQIKREPLEPEVQIHETEQNYAGVGTIGAVSITPISKNPNQKATINPNIMKLVQNNPHLTIKANMDQQPSPSNAIIDDKSYKCSSCWGAFANKSHLYFHKKNQCEGSKYPCPFCKKRFGTESAYSSHIFYSHPE